MRQRANFRNKFIIGLIFFSATVLLGIQSFAATSRKKAQATSQRANFLAKINEALIDVAEMIKPSVVNISIIKNQPLYQHKNQQYYYRKDYNLNPHRSPSRPRQEPRPRVPRAMGSGVIMSPDGYILTNHHVVNAASAIKVVMLDQREFTGKLIASDTKTDLAVIKIEAQNLPVLKIGDSDKLHVGELVIAVGNPYGFSQTVTMGIISAIGRSDVGIADYEDFIQTDAAINPGNSGGAMVNVRGELVGINTAIFSTTGGFQGIGFSIPSNMAKKVMDSLIKMGRVVRGWIGIQIQDLSPEIARHFNLADQKGVLIAEVFDKSPARNAGLLRGDLILQYNGKKINNIRQLRNLAAGTSPGKSVKMEILRNGKIMECTVTIGEFQEKRIMPRPRVIPRASGDIALENLNLDTKQKLNLPQDLQGVIIRGITTMNPAFKILKVNDVIVEINRQGVTDVNQFKQMLSQLSKDRDMLLLIYRASPMGGIGGYIYLSVPLRR